MESYKSLAGKVVIITGASSGIGKATAIEFAKLGSYLSLIGRNKERLDATLQECVKAGLPSDKVLKVTADITKEEDIKRIIRSTLGKFGTVNILVNNAGSATLSGLDTSVTHLDDMFNVHVRSIFLLTQLTLEHLKKNKGTIVNVSSILSFRPYPRSFAYCIAKSAQDQLTRCLALDLARFGIRVNSVNPGSIYTNAPKVFRDMNDEELKKLYDKIGQGHPLGRVGQSEEVARAIVFFASDAATFVTGTNSLVDGGWALTLSKY